MRRTRLYASSRAGVCISRDKPCNSSPVHPTHQSLYLHVVRRKPWIAGPARPCANLTSSFPRDERSPPKGWDPLRFSPLRFSHLLNHLLNQLHSALVLTATSPIWQTLRSPRRPPMPPMLPVLPAPLPVSKMRLVGPFPAPQSPTFLLIQAFVPHRQRCRRCAQEVGTRSVHRHDREDQRWVEVRVQKGGWIAPKSYRITLTTGGVDDRQRRADRRQAVETGEPEWREP